MPRPRSLKPTDPELAVLQVLWDRPGSTARDVHDVLAESRGYAITTVGTHLQRLHDKELVRIVDERKPQKYKATKTQEEVNALLLTDLQERAFGGSVKRVVMQLLSLKRATPKQLKDAERIIDSLDDKAE
jgi:BlaI family transcriptional regulator, penicillinase repressor